MKNRIVNESINNKILIIKGVLSEKCGLNPNLYDELSELLDDIKMLSDAKSSALENAYTELRQLTLPFSLIIIDMTKDELIKALRKDLSPTCKKLREGLRS